MSPEIIALAFIVLLVVYSITLHELAHAHASTFFGDPTPGQHGRLTWNPLVQIDIFSTVILPIVTFLLNGWPIGWAYCPIDPSKYKYPLRDNALVAVAGPVANLLIAGFFIALLWVPGFLPNGDVTQAIAFCVALFNVMLAIFNMLPLPGLDGYDVIRPLLPVGLRRSADNIKKLGMFTIFIVLFVGFYLFPIVSKPFINIFFDVLPSNLDNDTLRNYLSLVGMR